MNKKVSKEETDKENIQVYLYITKSLIKNCFLRFV